MPDVPLDLTMLNDADLMALFAKSVAWQNFAATISTEMEVTEAEWDTQVSHRRAQVLIKSWTGAKEDRVTISKAQQELDTEVQKREAKLSQVKAARKRAQTVRDNAERIASLVSRELTRRVGRDPVERRAGRWQP